jgi:23S rRNA (pseudouridine1915-N3)-methyltransferase
MKLLVVAVGQRQPDWADDGLGRLRQALSARDAAGAEGREGRAAPARRPRSAWPPRPQRIEAALPQGRTRRVLLDERGSRLTSAQLAERLGFWRGDGRDVAFVIGGPDGLDPALKAGADETLRLSDLTLPHAFARVLLAEALYRAWSVHEGHPYHRE